MKPTTPMNGDFMSAFEICNDLFDMHKLYKWLRSEDQAFCESYTCVN